MTQDFEVKIIDGDPRAEQTLTAVDRNKDTGQKHNHKKTHKHMNRDSSNNSSESSNISLSSGSGSVETSRSSSNNSSIFESSSGSNSMDFVSSGSSSDNHRMHRSSSGNSSLESSGSLGSLASSESSGGFSSDTNTNRNRDTGEMMRHKFVNNKINAKAHEQLQEYIKEVSNQVPDSKGEVKENVIIGPNLPGTKINAKKAAMMKAKKKMMKKMKRKMKKKMMKQGSSRAGMMKMKKKMKKKMSKKMSKMGKGKMSKGGKGGKGKMSKSKMSKSKMSKSPKSKSKMRKMMQSSSKSSSSQQVSSPALSSGHAGSSGGAGSSGAAGSSGGAGSSGAASSPASLRGKTANIQPNVKLPCEKQRATIENLKLNIAKRDQLGEKSPALQDAKELLLILQVRYANNCQKQNLAQKKTLNETEGMTKSLSWWWPTPPEIINKMFKLADLKAGEVVYDLGCGDGRIPVQAAVKWDCTGVGVDFDENLVKQAEKRAARQGVTNKVELRHGDALKVNDIEKADLVTLYILDRGMKLIKPILKAKMRKGARIVSHNYKFKDWKPTKELVATDKEGHKHWIYLYNV